jgi:hypothetical protein
MRTATLPCRAKFLILLRVKAMAAIVMLSPLGLPTMAFIAEGIDEANRTDRR